MRLDVVFTPVGLSAADLTGRTVFVIDVLRATTSICAALSHGARAIIPVANTEEALRFRQTLGAEEVLLAGEQNCLPIQGFNVGNSPREMTEEAVKGKLVVLLTTNGTRALLAAQGAGAVYPAAAATLGLVGERAREVWEKDLDLLIVCAGREQNFALDDAYCAGRLAVAAMGGRKLRRGLNDAALACVDLVRRYGERWERPLSASRAGRDLVRLGLREDVLDAARQDAYPVLAQYHDRRVTVVPTP
jgi:2-phosphosulfolactate phosphatase